MHAQMIVGERSRSIDEPPRHTAEPGKGEILLSKMARIALAGSRRADRDGSSTLGLIVGSVHPIDIPR